MFGIAGAALGVEALDYMVAGGGRGAGAPLSAAAVSLVASCAFVVALYRELEDLLAPSPGPARPVAR